MGVRACARRPLSSGAPPHELRQADDALDTLNSDQLGSARRRHEFRIWVQ